MSRFKFTVLPLAGLKLIERQQLSDGRGFLSRIYCADEFFAAGIDKHVMQINHTFTRRMGAVRGLHFQHPPHMETKLVSCLKGEIWDVAIDLRYNSSTFLQWHAETLSAGNGKSLLIPEGYAHGYQTLTDDCELIYLHTCPYHPEAEAAVHVADPRLKIAWPLPVSELSERDSGHPFIAENFQGIML